MSAPPSKPTTTTTTTTTAAPDSKPPADAKKPAVLEEDDEFEDFPVEDCTDEETQIPNGNAHLWEESWDDDDTNEDFAVQLREELKKLGK